MNSNNFLQYHETQIQRMTMIRNMILRKMMITLCIVPLVVTKESELGGNKKKKYLTIEWLINLSQKVKPIILPPIVAKVLFLKNLTSIALIPWTGWSSNFSSSFLLFLDFGGGSSLVVVGMKRRRKICYYLFFRI